ncbi:hypothetical protein F8B43_3878 [Methylorubrum populi]|uniref:Uncharacterized protein n=1 Tax=Methylorubrum populi TaxID=223967 RepID=A0A833J3M4_9HYPH|nr:hypothetical protein F8B43_3878 [Methylorubrum populi]
MTGVATLRPGPPVRFPGLPRSCGPVGRAGEASSSSSIRTVSPHSGNLEWVADSVACSRCGPIGLGTGDARRMAIFGSYRMAGIGHGYRVDGALAVGGRDWDQSALATATVIPAEVIRHPIDPFGMADIGLAQSPRGLTDTVPASIKRKPYNRLGPPIRNTPRQASSRHLWCRRRSPPQHELRNRPFASTVGGGDVGTVACRAAHRNEDQRGRGATAISPGLVSISLSRITAVGVHLARQNALALASPHPVAPCRPPSAHSQSHSSP